MKKTLTRNTGVNKKQRKWSQLEWNYRRGAQQLQEEVEVGMIHSAKQSTRPSNE